MTLTFQGGTSPPPLAAPIARRLSVSASVAGEDGLMSCVLPEELLIEILAERLMVSCGNHHRHRRHLHRPLHHPNHPHHPHHHLYEASYL